MEYEILEAKLKVLDARMSRAQKTLDKVKAERVELLLHCTHPEDKIVSESRYYDGSYYDKASTDRWRRCTVCGKTSEVTTETHSWYG